MRSVINIFVNAFLLFVVAYLVPGITVDNYLAALVAFLVISLINIFIKPILSLLTLPVNILTLGIFGLVLNILLFMLAASFVNGFQVSGFVSAALGLLLFSLLQVVVTKA